MKIVTAANGKKTIKMSKKEWMNIGKKAGWKVKAHGGKDQYIHEYDEFVDNLLFGNRYKGNFGVLLQMLKKEFGQEDLINKANADLTKILENPSNVDSAKEYLKNLIREIYAEHERSHEHGHEHEHEEHEHEEHV